MRVRRVKPSTASYVTSGERHAFSEASVEVRGTHVELGGPNGGVTVLLPVELFVAAFRRADYAVHAPGPHRVRVDHEIAQRAVALCAEPVGEHAVVQVAAGWAQRLRDLRAACADRVKALNASEEPSEEAREAS